MKIMTFILSDKYLQPSGHLFISNRSNLTLQFFLFLQFISQTFGSFLILFFSETQKMGQLQDKEIFSLRLLLLFSKLLLQFLKSQCLLKFFFLFLASLGSILSYNLVADTIVTIVCSNQFEISCVINSYTLQV